MLAPGRPLAGTRAVQGARPPRRPRGPLRRRRRQGVRAAHAARARAAPRGRGRAGAPSARSVVALDELEDLDGRLTAWLDEHGVEAVADPARRLRLRRRRGARRRARAGRRPALPPVHHRFEDHRPCPLTRRHPPQVPPRELQDHPAAGHDRLVLDRCSAPSGRSPASTGTTTSPASTSTSCRASRCSPRSTSSTAAPAGRASPSRSSATNVVEKRDFTPPDDAHRGALGARRQPPGPRVRRRPARRGRVALLHQLGFAAIHPPRRPRGGGLRRVQDAVRREAGGAEHERATRRRSWPAAASGACRT